MKRAALIALAIAFMAPQSAMAWNNRGHMTVAAIAYLNLTPAVRAKVDALLRQHPDISTISQGLAPNDPNFGISVFVRAATWPDLIKGDSRFVEGDAPSPGDPKPLPNFPFMIRGRNWHFIDLPFSNDGTRIKQPGPINALAKINEFTPVVGNAGASPNIQAYDLVWLLHLVGDVHQPLHCTARFTSQHPNGDRGGNAFKISDPNVDNLHSFWDDVLGSDESMPGIVGFANSIISGVQVPTNAASQADPKVWINESFTIAKSFVYTIGPEGNPDPKPSASATYRSQSEQIAKARVKLAGLRLASLINDRLK